MYVDGEGVPEDAAEAVRWLRMAAEQGNALAQSRLGFMYANGHGVPADDAEGVRWMRLAAEQGDVEAQITLGNRYRFSLSVLVRRTGSRPSRDGPCRRCCGAARTSGSPRRFATPRWRRTSLPARSTGRANQPEGPSRTCCRPRILGFERQ